LVTSVANGPASLAWGARRTRIHGADRQRPVVRAADLAGDAVMEAWHAARSGPKVLVAMQTGVPEAWVDAAGRTLPSVPVVSVVCTLKADKV
jgi:hypothetical protein